MRARVWSPVGMVLRRIRSLRARCERDRTGLCWIEGVRNFLHACDAGYPVETIVSSRVLLQHGESARAARRLAANGVSRVEVSPEQFRSVSAAEHASGIGAIVRQRWLPLEQAAAGPGLCWIVIEEIRSAGNLGTIVRTAEAVGASGLMFLGPQCDPFDPAAIRGSMGGLFALPLVRTTHTALEQWAEASRVHLVGLSPDADRLWTDLPSDDPIAIVVGTERSGLSGRQRALCRTEVRLPMTGRADSLNVGIALGVMLYELVRRDGVGAV